jgi:hypothetical protein
MSDERVDAVRRRGGVHVTRGGVTYEVRARLLQVSGSDWVEDEPVLRLDDVELLIEEAVEERLIEFGAYLYEKADNAGFDNDLFSQGMRNAAVDAELFVGFRDRWLAQKMEPEPVLGVVAPETLPGVCGG